MLWEWAVIWVVVGALLTICGYGMYQGGKTVWNILKSFEASLRKAVELTTAFEADFALIKQLLIAAQPMQPGGQLNSSESEGQPIPRAPIVPFPAAVLDRFKQEPIKEPDATKEDGGDVTGNEEDLISAERMESLREGGYVIEEPATPPPGREVESE